MAFLGENSLAEVWKIIGEQCGIYKEHRWWKITNTSVASGYNEKRTAITEMVYVTGRSDVL